MKNRKVLIASVLGLAAVVMAGGYALSAKAFDNNRSSDRARFHMGNMEDGSWYQGLSEDQKALLETIRTNQQKEMDARHSAMDKAITDGDYVAWAALVRQYMGDDAPILTQVTADNFATFVEGYKLMQQAREKFASIGLDEMGFGMGGHGMMKRGKAFRLNGSAGLGGLTSTSTAQ